MLDGRIYRTGLVVVALALLVLGFSFVTQPGPLSTSLAPDAFNGQNVFNTMIRLSRDYPARPPGSAADYDLASSVAGDFVHDGFNVSKDTFTGQTADGNRTLENVAATRPGVQSGSIVVLASRDAQGSPATAAVSGTATEIELARDLSGETLRRTVVLASTSGSQGMAGAIRLASTVAGPVDAVIVLGDLASAHVHQPVIVPWSTIPLVAPPALRNTVTAELSQQAAIGNTGTSFIGQLAHLAFPLTVTGQAPFGARGIPSVLLSLSGEQGPAANAALAGPDQITAVGRSILATVSALDNGPTLPAPSAYILFAGKLVPGWAISLFVLALIVPVVLTTIDGLARARRHGHVVWRWLVLVLAAAVPFALGALVVLAARALGVISVAPAGPVPAGTVPTTSSGIAALVVAALVAIGLFLVLRPIAIRFTIGSGPQRRAVGDFNEGVIAALLLVMCAVTIALWTTNPYAAALAVPALHVWLAAVSPDIRLRLPFRLMFLLLGFVPVIALVVYYASILGLSPMQLLWSATLLLAGHVVSVVEVLEWTVFLGCAVVTSGVLLLAARQASPEPVPVTVRGPITYAGPGSLGGTKSALRR